MKSEPAKSRAGGAVRRASIPKHPDIEALKSRLAAEIVKSLDREHLTLRAAHARTGIAAADLSRIRNAELGRFTVDRLISILNRFDRRVEIKVRVSRPETVPHTHTSAA